jgi:hypothetical protein
MLRTFLLMRGPLQGSEAKSAVVGVGVDGVPDESSEMT